MNNEDTEKKHAPLKLALTYARIKPIQMHQLLSNYAIFIFEYDEEWMKNKRNRCKQ